MNLSSLLHSTFGFAGFRANQEAVCRAATDGRDCLLVMPTGAGKSLCYQLPVIARQQQGHAGAGLVVSPLIALMDDQAAKLTAAGLRVARIHSGLSRDDARQACRDYLDGKLQFLFIAPERMRVPGFPEMLAKRKPALIAIDEAHCISAWGHDFRPDYRTLGEHLPALRPAPIIALTATATPTVQRDIVAQLHLQQPALFIHGFRRENLAIEVMELSKPQRAEFTANFLQPQAARPAIVYAPSRKAAEELAAHLHRSFPAAAYHAGLEASVRERVQRQFQSGKLEVVVATIAFGMGIDKADVRTVVHTALPASVEAFYQEIGRAGRDGLPARTVLLHSFADRKMHEFFLDRDYPPPTDLARVAACLTDVYLMPDLLAGKLKMDRDLFLKSVEKLAAQGVAQIDLGGLVRRSGSPETTASWQSGYAEQIAFRRAQIDRMIQFAETQQCRMTALIRHFGDTADGHRPCGLCDFCSPNSATAQTFAQPTPQEEHALRAILRALDANPKATGRLFTDAAVTHDRRHFDALLDGLARAGLITLSSETWTNPAGDLIAFKKAALTHEARTLGSSEPLGVMLRPASSAPAKLKSRKRAAASSRPAKMPVAKPAAEKAPSVSPDTPSLYARQRAPTPDPTAALDPAQQQLDRRLRAWRQAESEKIGLPQFFVLGSSTLRSIVLTRPSSLTQLRGIAGMGPEKTDRFGASILEICNS